MRHMRCRKTDGREKVFALAALRDELPSSASRWRLHEKEFDIDNISQFEQTKTYATKRLTQFANEDFVYQDLNPEEAAAARAILGI